MGWTQREDIISRKTAEVARSGRSLWFSLTEWKLWIKTWREIMNVRRLRSPRGDTLWPESSHFNPKSYTAPAGTSRNSALISSPIGLANKLVQFKKRPLYSCSLKAAYTKTYEKNLWYSKTRKTSPWRFKSILLYIHKRGCKIKMTEGKTFRSHVSWPQFFK